MVTVSLWTDRKPDNQTIGKEFRSDKKVEVRVDVIKMVITKSSKIGTCTRNYIVCVIYHLEEHSQLTSDRKLNNTVEH